MYMRGAFRYCSCYVNITSVRKVWRYKRGVIRICKKDRQYNGENKKDNNKKQWSIKHYTENTKFGLRIMGFNATFNNISVISRRSVILVEENGVPGENYRPATSHEQTLLYKYMRSTCRLERESNLQCSGERHWLHR